ncbi:Cupin domain protein [Enhygromyxa salina]|uniref:Cupin domain protein n=1 Tax=Enhygromyxa salina TaxID=215803 RepID=A0A2S9YD99_9BACT|nr:cupin domain-containing protein [Enhygromyxa salina]PRQ03084.1 Cupin domain protein [Enhygromyxa salina]
MRRSTSPVALLLTFLLGACTSVALQSSAATRADADEASPPDPRPDPSALAATVVAFADAPSATAPNGKATITHLARGHNAYLGHLRMDANGAVPPHRDPTEEYIHVLEGSGVMTIDGQEYAIAAGTTIYMPADAEVSYQNGDQEMVAVQIFAGPEPAAKYEAWEAKP